MRTLKGTWRENIEGVAGSFRTDDPSHGVPAELHIQETKTVYQFRYRNAWGNWLLTRRLYTVAEAYNQFGETLHEPHAGPFEVPAE